MVKEPQVIAVAVGAAGAAVIPGLTVTAKVAAPALVPQLLPAVTVILPLTAVLVALTVMVRVPAPAVMLQPVGTDQL
jgi:hypothetical protein